MEWEDIGRGVGRFFLAALEYSFKICALVATAISLYTRGELADKITNSFGSLPLALRHLTEVPGQLVEMGTLIHDYNTQAITAFTQSYGVGATNNLLLTLGEGVEYFIVVYNNFLSGPLATLVAMVLVFVTFYSFARILRFARRKGQGSLLTRLERKLAGRIFGSTAFSGAGPVNSSRNSGASRKASKANRRFRSRSRLKMPVNDNKNETSSSGIRIANKPGRQQKGGIAGYWKQENEMGPDQETLDFMLNSARS